MDEVRFIFDLMSIGFFDYFKVRFGPESTADDVKDFIFEEVVITIIQDYLNKDGYDLDWDEVEYKHLTFVEKTFIIDVDHIMNEIFKQYPELKENYNKYQIVNFLNCIYPFKFIINHD